MAAVFEKGEQVAVTGTPPRVANRSRVDFDGMPELIMTPSEASPTKAKEGAKTEEDVTFLIEVVKTTLPIGRGRRRDNTKGMHVTAHWVGPTNPSGRKRRENLLHRTKALKINSKADGDSSQGAIKTIGSSSSDVDDTYCVDEVDCTEHIFTVDDRNLFLFRTSTKQLVNASVKSTSGEDITCDIFKCGGLRFDVFERPRDMLNSVFSTIVASDRAMKEANASTMESSAFSGYRLVGSVFLPPEEILTICDEQRFQCDLIENWRNIHHERGNSTFESTSTKKVDGGRLVLRFRLASEFDVAFVNSLSKSESSTTGVDAALRNTLVQTSDNEKLKPAQLITEYDENLLTAESGMKAISNISPIAQESVRYLFSNDTEKRVLVKPYPDPERPTETTWFTEDGLQHECYKPSTRWIQAGQEGECSLGKVYFEVLECRGLPNVDTGGSIGNKTDAFVSVVYGDIMVQTEVIDDSLAPMWLPWTSRAYVFQLGHPSTTIYIGVSDYDIGPLEHEYIGRAAIHLAKLSPNTEYTLTYALYESSNLHEKGDDFGTITVRLRLEIPDEKKYLLKGWKEPEYKWVNSLQWKTHRVAKMALDGPHDEEVFEMRLFRSHINELLTQKRYMSMQISDAVRSLVFWRGQVKVGQVWLPLHSAAFYYFSVHVVENPRLLPSFVLFGFGWVMIANCLLRVSHPNPWHRGHRFYHYWCVLTRGKSPNATVDIRPMQGHKEARKHEMMWKQRIADDDEKYAKQVELDAKIKTISDEARIRTKAQAKGALADPISAMAGAKLLPYQQILSGYCNRVRYIRNVLNWTEESVSFYFTLVFFGAGFVALFIPWGFLFRWTTRIIVWVFLGPWMRIFDMLYPEESEAVKSKAKKQAMKMFHEQHQAAKILRENALKMKAFRVKLFGNFITRLPEFNLTRHEDVPLPESSAKPYRSDEKIKCTRFVPSQDLTGTMIPKTGQDAAQSQARKQKEKTDLLEKYQRMVQEKPDLANAAKEEVDEGFELIGTEDRIVCVHSDPSEDAIVESEKSDTTEITHTRSNSDALVSDKSIQLALDKEVQERKPDPPKTKWIFSASLKLSLRKEIVEDVSAPALCNGTPSLCHEANKMIEDGVEEEGVEIVPLLGSGGGETAESDTAVNDHVSLFYVKDDAGKAGEGDGSDHEDEGGKNTTGDDRDKDTADEGPLESGAALGKTIRFKETLSEID